MKFFDLKDYFISNFTLVTNFNWSLQDIENSLCWEREIYLKLVRDQQEKKRQQKTSEVNGIEFYNL